MSEVQILRIGNGESGCLHCEIAELLRRLLYVRYAHGQGASAADLRAALIRITDEIEKQLLELGEAGETLQ